MSESSHGWPGDDHKTAIATLCDVLLGKARGVTAHDPALREAVRVALDVMATWPEVQYEIGSKVALESARNMTANDDSVCWSIGLLARSRDNRAIDLLTRFLHYEVGGGTDHIECCEAPVVRAAKKALWVLVGNDSELRYKVAVEATKSTYFDYLLKDWTSNLLQSVQKDANFYKPARALLEKFT